MYTENRAKDVALFAKAVLSNQLAKFAPKLYVKMTHQTGRGEANQDPGAVAAYFLQCFQDYRDKLGFSPNEFDAYLSGKKILEYGPGDILGVALLFFAHGAEHVTCVDQFPLSNLSEANVAVYRQILAILDGPARERASRAFRSFGDPHSGFDPSAIRYEVTGSGLIGASAVYDLIVSRAVLEHVSDLASTMFDVKKALKPDGVSIHQVDLKSHGLDRYVPFDFLTWPAWAYKVMYGHKGFPNRWRTDTYQALAARANLSVRHISPTGLLPQEEARHIYPAVANEFRQLPVEQFSWLGFWMVLAHR